MKSYKPICLLPVLGKILERLMVEEMRDIFYSSISDWPYGYMTGRSTEDAIAEMESIVKTRREQYCYGIFLDMSRAFDRVWWPKVNSKLYNRGVSGQCLRVMEDYLQGRCVEIRDGLRKEGKKVNRGCPKGSILGPQIWIIVMDGLIEECKRADCEIVDYADDEAIIIWSNSRSE